MTSVSVPTSSPSSRATSSVIASCPTIAASVSLSGGGALREFGGEVTGVIAAGAFVAFGDGYEGMLPVRRLPGYWELDATETGLVTRDCDRRLRIGDPLVVQVARVDTARGRVDLSPVELALR